MQRNVIRTLMILMLIFVVAASMTITQGGGAPGGGVQGGGGRGGKRAWRRWNCCDAGFVDDFPGWWRHPSEVHADTDVSPELTWAAPPAGTVSFLMEHSMLAALTPAR